jgi:KipI family sensor histidine kinase inhibitor
VPAVLPYGDRAVLVELDEADAVAIAGYAARVRRSGIPGIVDVVPAARTVLVVVDPEVTTPAGVGAQLAGLRADDPDTDDPDPDDPDDLGGAAPAGRTVTIDVRYDGPDLADVARHSGLSVAEVIRRHGAPTYRSAFCGFAPGFAYLTGLDPALQLPRRPTPRTRVPRGSVAIAAEYCGIYPQEMPGGWHLLGRTDAVLFDLALAVPALLVAGTAVRFRPIA